MTDPPLSAPSQGDYDLVANEYERAQSLFTGTKVAVFQQGAYMRVCVPMEPMKWCVCVAACTYIHTYIHTYIYTVCAFGEL